MAVRARSKRPPGDAAEPAAQPYESSLAQLRAELDRIDLLVRMQAIRSRQLAGDDAYRGLVISDAEAFSLLDRPAGSAFFSEAPEIRELKGKLAELDHLHAARHAESRKRGIPLRLDELTARFALEPLDVQALLLALLPELDARYERLYAYIQDDITRKRPTVDLALALFCSTFTERLQARSRFAPDAPMLQHQLIEVFCETPSLRPTRLGSFFKLDERIADFLLDGDQLDARLVDRVRLWPERQALTTLVLPSELKDRLQRVTQKNGPPAPVVSLCGPRGSGRRSVAAALSLAQERPLLVVDGSALAAAHEESLATTLRLTLREAHLRDAALLIEQCDVLLSVAGEAGCRRLLHSLAAFSGPLYFSAERPFVPTELARPVMLFELPAPRSAERAELWRRALGSPTPPDLDGDLAALASRYRLTAGQIHEVVSLERGLGDPPSFAELSRLAQNYLQPKLGSLARRIAHVSTWEDLVLSPDRLQRLREIEVHARHRALVLEHWGFAGKLPTGQGLSVLFCGPPGTGKTLAASVLAKQLGLELYQIDLSAVVSKYVGETEKQLAQVFAQAESGNAILFFDEADALFGERGKTRDAHDRYANLEVAYLLQRMDSYAGVVILATNLVRNMDDAFMRRMRFIVDFPLPGVEERQRIWQTILPIEMPRGADLDLADLAQRFELSGGHISNIALAAAFLAAEEGSPLLQRHLLRATQREYQKLGKMADDKLFAPKH